MNGDVSIDLGTLVPYAEQRILSIFGKDQHSLEWNHRVKDLSRISLEHASYVQSVGMNTPVPIQKIYQPARLTRKSNQGSSWLAISDLLRNGEDAVIFAGPGRGKTTLLHHLYVRLAADDQVVPFLFTLRWANATTDLVEFVDHLRTKAKPKHRILFLVDGYDEISVQDREAVSRALTLFKSQRLGQFLVTCRTFYDVGDLKVMHYILDSFSREDSLRFVEAFAEIYEVELNAANVISDLELRGFADFISHPLMLTLVCILRTGPNAEIPRRAIGLIRRALETLTFRWDEAKHVHRSSQLPLDGEERVRCLMRIAFEMQDLQASQEEVEEAVRKHLRLIQMTKVNGTRLIEELAQWYGILVPLDDSHWQFVHRTIHDYLGARYWVENGLFASAPPPSWDARTAYAICLLQDGTDMIVRMLNEAGDLAAFAECLYNRAAFDVMRVAAVVVARVHKRGHAVLAETADGWAVRADEEFYKEAGPEFLRALVQVASAVTGHVAGTVVACYALGELHRREIRTSQQTLGGALGDLYRKHRLASIEVYGNPAFPLASVVSL
jgi:hypothetical protein